MRSFFQNFTFTFLAKTQYVFLTPSLVTTSTGLKSFFSKECANASAVSNLPDGNCTDLFFASRHTQGCPCASILSISAISRNPQQNPIGFCAHRSFFRTLSPVRCTHPTLQR